MHNFGKNGFLSLKNYLDKKAVVKEVNKGGFSYFGN
jgi:hypothetical protein